MYKGKSNLAVIIARGGSKGLPGKNLRALGGKPLIAWTIEAAARSRYLDRVVLSSDDAQIIAVARRWGCEVPFVRPAHLAADDVPAVDPLLHAAQFVGGADYVTLLQPTSPFRTSADIDGCIARCIDSGAPSCVTVAPVRKSPAWMFHLEADQLRPVLGGSVDVYLRQQLPPAFALNGAVYVEHLETLRRTKKMITPQTGGYVMPAERSVDIDTELDFRFAQSLFGQLRKAA